MPTELVLDLQNVSKVYRWGRNEGSGGEFHALHGATLKVRRGETVGLIGPNGSGKSTLLQIAAGVTRPTTGRVHRHGRIRAILELGGGLNPELTGRENFYLQCELGGVDRRQADGLFAQVAEFSELGDFLYRPVRSYSTGMYVRLAFSSAIFTLPDAVLVDEALAVGDAVFASRCIRKIEELQRSGVTLLLVSHDLGLVKKLCARAAFLLKGRIVCEGDAKEVTDRYLAHVLEQSGSDSELLDGLSKVGGETGIRHGDGSMKIAGVRVLGGDGAETAAVESGQPMTVEMAVEAKQDCENALFGILIRDRYGNDVFGTNTRVEEIPVPPVRAGQTLAVRFAFPAGFTRGVHTIAAAAQYYDGWSRDWIHDAAVFEVICRKDYAGVAALPCRAEVALADPSRE